MFQNNAEIRKRKIEKEFGIEIAELPSIADPRKIPEELFSCMDLMLGQLSPKARKSRGYLEGYDSFSQNAVVHSEGKREHGIWAIMENCGY